MAHDDQKTEVELESLSDTGVGGFNYKNSLRGLRCVGRG